MSKNINLKAIVSDRELLSRANFQGFIKKIVSMTHNTDPNKINTELVLIKTMEFVEHLKKIVDKKKAVIYIYDLILKQMNVFIPDTKLVGESIEIIIALSKGHFDINRVSKCTANFIPRFFTIIANAVKNKQCKLGKCCRVNK
jgi:hypothetical protein